MPAEIYFRGFTGGCYPCHFVTMLEPNHSLKSMLMLLDCYLSGGVDTFYEATPQNHCRPKKTDLAQNAPVLVQHVAKAPPLPAAAVPLGAAEAIHDAKQRAAAANTIEELRRALDSFEGCALRKTANSTVFGEGDEKAGVLLIGEAPGADEDKYGRPFVGVSGQLLDKMLAAIGLGRDKGCYISNIVYWRPPGNRKPSASEIAVCQPFMWRLMELIQPKLILLAGDTAAKAVLGGNVGITRLRGTWHEVRVGEAVIPVMPIFHPAFLLRSPALKRDSWRDLLAVQQRLDDLNS